ncbi:MAG: hypothetical protein R3D30_10500 [Hyphomicrobiales bacterium]
MANPDLIQDPEEFLEIAKYNNDAYKRRMAAQYEAITRATDGKPRKIGPEHVQGYMDEMNDFVAKKRGKIDEIFAKGPSYLSDPAHRAELFQAMAQEQKYVSRLGRWTTSCAPKRAAAPRAGRERRQARLRPGGAQRRQYPQCARSV